MQNEVELKWSDLQKDEKESILQNYDDQPRLAFLKENVKRVNQIKFTLGEQKLQKVMVGLCDKKIRLERGMILQDKSFIGHGTYLLYSVDSYNSFLFSHWDLDANYNEGGFVLGPQDQIEVNFELETRILKITDINKPKRCLELKTEHHNIEDLHICVVIIQGELQFYK